MQRVWFASQDTFSSDAQRLLQVNTHNYSEAERGHQSQTLNEGARTQTQLYKA